ncbi:MAG: flotillin domain-containing protein [Paracoccaceae bacterium]|nr:flotillin domain-containing protein [Paracoccaceae bacterium]MDG1739765.1 flotillin domain-containing protein [Paracoccaceae bacterium]MDG2257582.1 flotillin domain-containing protein [Paracoccaceae bacterium]
MGQNYAELGLDADVDLDLELDFNADAAVDWTSMAISRFQTLSDLELGGNKIRTEANKLDKLAEAEGTRALVDADNENSEEIVAMKIQLARLQALPEIVAQNGQTC